MVIDMNKRNEKISAFLDNEMHRDEIMSFSLSGEADDAKVAQRYQMVGDALRGELSASSSFIDISQAVSDALANENIADEMNVDKINTESVAGHSTSAAGNKKASTGFDWSSLFRPAAGMATAALVAVVVVFSLSDNDSVGPNSVAVQDAGTSESMNKVALTQPASIQPASIQQSQAQFRTVANVPGQPAQMNTLLSPGGVNNAGLNGNRATKMSPYINQHLEFARQETLQGRMPYVRAVSFENKAQ